MFGGIALIVCVAALSSAQTPQNAPDVVRLKNGGMLRGTISELVPNDHVTILLITGETRTVSFAEIEYAGPFQDSEPGSAAKAEKAAPEPSGAALTLTAPNDDLTYYLPAGRSVGTAIGSGTALGVGIGGGVSGGVTATRVEGVSYTRLCIAPCTIKLQPGNYRFAVGEKEEPPVLVKDAIAVGGDTTLAARYQSFQGLRTAGNVLSLVSAAIGIAVIVEWGVTNLGDDMNAPLDPVQPLIGGAIAIGGGLIGLLVSSKSDEAFIDQVAAE